MRLLLITNVFPTPLQSSRGVFNRELVRALRGSHEMRVVCPLPWTDELSAARGGRRMPAGRASVVEGVPSSYPRFYFTPKIFRPQYAAFMWRSIRRTVMRDLMAFRPDAVIGYWAHPDGEMAVRAARLANVPSVVMVGGSDIMLMTRNARRRQRVLDVLRAADAIVPVSQSLRAKLIELGLDAAKIHVVERGVDTAVFHPGDRDEARRRVGIDFAGPVLTAVGRLVPVKGLDILIAACAELRRRGISFQVCLVGDGPLRSALAEQARAAGLEDVIRFVGSVAHHQLPDWYRAADVMVLPSRSEGIPNVLREASACGTPYVASNVGGIPELPDATQNRLVPPENVGALADALADAITELSKGNHIQRARTAAPPANWDDSAHALAQIISTLRDSAGHDGIHMYKPPPDGEIRVSTGSPWLHRRFVRRAIEMAIPRRLFLARGPAGSRSIGLSFDDGPHPEHTPRVLDALGEHGVRATFFVVGRRAMEHPHLIRRMVAEGHTVGHHSFHHAPVALTPVSQLLEEVRQTQDTLKQSAGVTSQLFRPPFGKVTVGKMLRLWRAGQTVVLWSFDPRDYACASSEQLVHRMRARPPRDSDIVLLHDSQPHTAPALGPLIRAARNGGLDFCTLDRWAV
jgi:glycosyltransferase involved in cell wall biosynthesis/peptidoglycan/xylan/chitin deacetylase (PgdA/CDA1 family)